VLDHQGAAGILPKPSDERKRGEAFPTIKISEPNEAIPLSHYWLPAFCTCSLVVELSVQAATEYRCGPVAPWPPDGPGLLCITYALHGLGSEALPMRGSNRPPWFEFSSILGRDRLSMKRLEA
jgi:hypothetical protein